MTDATKGGVYLGPDYRGHGKPVQQGCICPPTSERTCQNQLCPRKALPTPFPADARGYFPRSTP